MAEDYAGAALKSSAERHQEMLDHPGMLGIFTWL
jgi:hypothetical protein